MHARLLFNVHWKLLHIYGYALGLQIVNTKFYTNGTWCGVMFIVSFTQMFGFHFNFLSNFNIAYKQQIFRMINATSAYKHPFQHWMQFEQTTYRLIATDWGETRIWILIEYELHGTFHPFSNDFSLIYFCTFFSRAFCAIAIPHCNN